MINKVEVNSNFLKSNLNEVNQIHFLGNDNEASFYINIDDLGSFENDVQLSFWVEFEQTNNAPIIILYLKLNYSDQESLFEFIYDIKEENDIYELSSIIDNLELNINVMEFKDDILFFGFKYFIYPNKNFIEELKRLIFQAQEYTRVSIEDYDFDIALDDFLDGRSIFNSRTNTVSEFDVVFPQNEINKDENLKDDSAFTYISKTSGDFHDEGDTLQVKVYKRDVYEKLKNNDDDKDSEEADFNFLKKKIKELENKVILKDKKIEELTVENTHLKEELEYRKLDTPKKGWKLF